MTMLAGVFSALLLSPLLFVALLIAGAGLLLSGRKRAGSWLVAVTTLCLLVFSTPGFSSLLLRPLESRSAPLAGNVPSVDAVVILGGGTSGGDLSAMALQRVVGGFGLAHAAGVPVVVSGGRTWASDADEPEAVIAARLLVRLGMPEGKVITENASTTTWENAREVGKILRARGWTRVALVTSAWHMPRAMLAFRRAGVECFPVPSGSLAGTGRFSAQSLLPGFESLGDSFVAFREYLGIAAYAARR